MGVFAGLKELLKNFTTQINDNNIIDQDISDDNFVKLAMANGMSASAIAEMTKTRNGIQLPTKKEENKVEQKKSEAKIKEKKLQQKEENKEKGFER